MNKIILTLLLFIPLFSIGQMCGDGTSRLDTILNNKLYILICREIPKIRKYEVSVFNHPKRELLGRDTLLATDRISKAFRILKTK